MRQERRRADAAHKRQNEVHKNHSEGRAEVGDWAESDSLVLQGGL